MVVAASVASAVPGLENESRQTDRSQLSDIRLACGLKCGVNQAGTNPAAIQNLNRNDQGEPENGQINDRPAAVPAVVVRLPKAFADGADAGTGMVAAGFCAGGAGGAGGAGACVAAGLLPKPGRSSASTSASTLSGSAHEPRHIHIDPHQNHGFGDGKRRRQLLRRTQPQRLADGFHLREELRHRPDTSGERERVRTPVPRKFATKVSSVPSSTCTLRLCQTVQSYPCIYVKTSKKTLGTWPAGPNAKLRTWLRNQPMVRKRR